MRVRVYYNLRKNCLSVVEKSTRRVYRYTQGISLSNVKFIVSQKGVERIRRNKRKEVIAFVEGWVMAWHASEYCWQCGDMRRGFSTLDGIEVLFNPYKWKNFVLKNGKRKITSASYVAIDGKKIKAYL